MLSMMPKWLARLLANDSFNPLMDLDLLHVEPSHRPGMTMGQRQGLLKSTSLKHDMQSKLAGAAIRFTAWTMSRVITGRMSVMEQKPSSCRR